MVVGTDAVIIRVKGYRRRGWGDAAGRARYEPFKTQCVQVQLGWLCVPLCSSIVDGAKRRVAGCLRSSTRGLCGFVPGANSGAQKVSS